MPATRTDADNKKRTQLQRLLVILMLDYEHIYTWTPKSLKAHFSVSFMRFLFG